MAMNAYDFRMDERPTVQAREAVGNVLTAATRDRSSIDEAHHSDHYLPRGPGYGLLPLPAGRWTPAHTEAARFLGECFAVGAVLGLVVEMARPMGGQRHG
jgi:hypothetical protein